jgi:hypothetical protein
MFHNGYFVHPDIWMLWFSFFVTAAVAVYAVGKLVYWLVRLGLLMWDWRG